MKRNVVILAAQYLNDNMELSIGGIQTYITKLAETLAEHYNIFIVQESTFEFEIKTGNATIVGVLKGANKALYAESSLLKDNDLLIYSTENILDKTRWKNKLVIQHGVYWDVPPTSVGSSFLAKKKPRLYQLINLFRVFKKISRFNRIVSVDFNFFNFYKVFYPDAISGVNVITNFAADDFFTTNDSYYSSDGKIRILFARRFIDIRGVNIFLESIRELNEYGQYGNVEFIFSGEGREEERIKSLSEKYDNVTVVKTNYSDMPRLISKCDISVIPSIGSEGTSLTLLESMAAKKVVLCTPCGGMSNIVIDGFNGFLFLPNTKDFIKTLKKVIDKFETLDDVEERARQTVKESFCESKWKKQWLDVVKKYIEK